MVTGAGPGEHTAAEDRKTAGDRKAAADRPIFIVGCARSGTTLLQLLLHAHPRIAIPPENRYLMEVYDRRADFGDLRDAANVDRVVDWIIGEASTRPTKFKDLGLDADAVRRAAHEAPPTLGSVLGVVLALYAARWGKPRWGDKRPNYIRRLPQLLKLFPDAQFLHIIRDGRDCVASLKDMPWWTYGTKAAIRKWVEAMETGDWARASLRDDQYHELRYEDLVADPERELRAVCAFLGEAFDDGMLDHHQLAAEAVPTYKAWHTRTHRRIDAQAVGGWKSKLNRYELRLMDNVAGPHLRARGYRRSPIGLLLPAPDKALRGYRRSEARLERRERDYQASDRAIDDACPWPVAADLARIRPAATGLTSA